MDARVDPARAEARRRVDADGAASPSDTPDPVALAWALKDLCYESWSSDPARAARAAEVLAQLSTAGLAPAGALQVRGLAAWTAGIARVVRGQMAEAVTAFDQAAQALGDAGMPDPAAQTQVPKIMALSMLGQHEQAVECAVAAQRALLSLGNVAAASRVSLNLGGLMLRRDAYADAARHYRDAAVLFARTGDHLHSVLADIGLAGALASMGDFDEALRIYARARMRAVNQSLGQPLAMVDESVALVELARGRYREALAGLESARRGFEALGLPHSLAIAEKQLADAYLDLRLLPEALALFDAAVAKFADLALPDEQAAALAQRGRAQALLGQGKAADRSFASAAALFAAQDHPVGLASVTLALAELALAEGQPALALTRATEAAAGFAVAGHSEGGARADVIRAQALWEAGRTTDALVVYAATLEQARQRQQLQVQVRCLTGQGIAAGAAGQPEAARAALEAAIELLEDQRRALPGDDLRSAFLTDRLRPYQELLRLALADGTPVRVLHELERYRARSFADSLGEEPEEACGPTDADAGLRERLHWLHRRVQRLQEESAPFGALQAELVRTERELLERVRRRRLAAPAAARPLESAGGFDVAALQAVLGPSDALVEYGVLDDELFALVVDAGQVRLQRHLASWAEVTRALQAARFQIDTLRHGVAPWRAHLPVIEARTAVHLQQLHRLVWAPLHAALRGRQRVAVVPHGALGALPFAALHTGEAPLGAGLELALVSSARAAQHGLARRRVPVGSVFALGESSRLPHAAREAHFVAGLFPEGESRVGDAATLAALQSGAGAADVLHLACHAQFRGDNPRFSALHLHDGVLTVERAERLRLRPGLVVLSACESGLADDEGAGEMVGLVRAFLVAGTSRVVATLWPVDDEVTADFMTDFYAALTAGDTPARALQRAQAALRRHQPVTAHWAAFVVYGGW